MTETLAWCNRPSGPLAVGRALRTGADPLKPYLVAIVLLLGAFAAPLARAQGVHGGAASGAADGRSPPVAPDRTTALLDSAGAWFLLSDPNSPPMLRRPVAAYDSKRHRLLVLEGAYGTGWPAVYSLDFEPEPHWSTLSVVGPVPVGRVGPSLIYDSLRDRLLLFGGSGYNDVWSLTLSGTPTWQPIYTAGERPEVRCGHSAVYDDVRDRMVVFGGLDNVSYLSDAWSLSLASNQWTALALSGTRPPARAWHRTVLDPPGDRMVLFGGLGPTGPANDLWALSLGDSSSWAPLTAVGMPPSPRYSFGAALDTTLQRIYVQGGAVAGGYAADLWSLDLSGSPTWTPVTTVDSLEGRADQAMIFDPTQDRLVVYGGTGATGTWDQCADLAPGGPLQWERFLPPSPPLVPGPRSSHVVVYDSRRSRLMAYGGSFRRTDVPLWAFSDDDQSAWTPLITSGPAPPVGPAVFDSAGDRMLLFSGSDTWALTLNPTPAWNVVDSAAPPNLEGASFTYDPLRHRVIVYGGQVYYPHTDFYTLPDVWALELDPAPTWTHLGVGPTSQGSAGHAAIYDPERDRLVIMGGWWRNGSTISHSYGNTMWATPLNGPLTWTVLPPGNVDPPAGQPVYDSVRDRFLLFSLYGAMGVWDVWSRPATCSAPWALLGSAGAGPLAASPVLFDPQRDRAVMLFTAPNGAATDQAWALNFGSFQVSLTSLTATPTGAELVWDSPLAIGWQAVIQRREEIGSWLEIARAVFDETGRVTVRDRTVRAGGRYAYRLGIQDAGAVRFSDSVWVDIPAKPQLALEGARPNPAFGALSIAFSLPDAAPAQLEIVDVAGRRVLSQEVGGSPGDHTVEVASAGVLAPGLYLVRLTHRGESLVTRACLIR